MGHLTLCFISLLCEAHVTHALRENHDRYRGRAVFDRVIKPRQLSAVTVLRELAEVRAIPIKIGDRNLWVRTDIKGHVAKLFQSLGLRPAQANQPGGRSGTRLQNVRNLAKLKILISQLSNSGLSPNSLLLQNA